MFTESSEGPLVAEVVLFCVLVLDESVIFLIYGVVGQMHVLIILVDFLSIGFRGKPGEAFLENIDS